MLLVKAHLIIKTINLHRLSDPASALESTCKFPMLDSLDTLEELHAKFLWQKYIHYWWYLLRR